MGRVVHEDVDSKWWSIPAAAGSSPTPSGDGRWIAFVSDRDGWDHLYVLPSSGGTPIQLTRGRFEAWRPVWSPDSTRIAFDANEEAGRPGSRHLGIVTVGTDPSLAKIETITTGRGTDISPQWAPDSHRLLYQHTDAQNSADLFTTEAAAGAQPTQALKGIG